MWRVRHDARGDGKVIESRPIILELTSDRGSSFHIREPRRLLQRIEDTRRMFGESVDNERVVARANGREVCIRGNRLAQRSDYRGPLRRGSLDVAERREMSIRRLDGRAPNQRRRQRWMELRALLSHEIQLVMNSPQLDHCRRDEEGCCRRERDHRRLAHSSPI